MEETVTALRHYAVAMEKSTIATVADPRERLPAAV